MESSLTARERRTERVEARVRIAGIASRPMSRVAIIKGHRRDEFVHRSSRSGYRLTASEAEIGRCDPTDVAF